MKKKYKISLVLIAVLIIAIIFFLALKSFKKVHKRDTLEQENIKVLDNLSDYGYSLDERDSKIMKETYDKLKDLLLNEPIDYEEYAKYLAELFVIDLWTMNNKTNKYDVGGTDYIYPANVDNYKLNVENTIYKNIENNVNGSRKQLLPTVESIISVELTKGNIKILDKDTDCFIVSLVWDYKQDLGYDTEATITIINENNKLYIVEYKAGE